MKENLGSILRYVLMVSALTASIVWLSGGFSKGKVVVKDSSGRRVAGAHVWVSYPSAAHAPEFITGHNGVAWLTVKNYDNIHSIIVAKDSLTSHVDGEYLTRPLHVTLQPERE